MGRVGEFGPARRSPRDAGSLSTTANEDRRCPFRFSNSKLSQNRTAKEPPSFLRTGTIPFATTTSFSSVIRGISGSSGASPKFAMNAAFPCLRAPEARTPTPQSTRSTSSARSGSILAQSVLARPASIPFLSGHIDPATVEFGRIPRTGARTDSPPNGSAAHRGWTRPT